MILNLMKQYIMGCSGCSGLNKHVLGQNWMISLLWLRTVAPLEKFNIPISHNPVNSTTKCHILPKCNYS